MDTDRSLITMYRERIDLALRYILQHLDEPLRLDSLAQVSGFSMFHFHRIFTAFTGETPGDYIRRMRLQRAAWMLCGTRSRITEVAFAAGYETPSAFARAFTQLYGLSPSAYRRASPPLQSPPPAPSAREAARERIAMQSPEIRTLPDQTIIYVRKKGLIEHNFDQTAAQAFQALGEHITRRKLWSSVSGCLGITVDDPSLVDESECRYDGAFILTHPEGVKPEGEVGVRTLPGGRYAVFQHRGPYTFLWKTWNAVYSEWLPASGLTLRDAPPYELYVDDPQRTPPEQLLTEIFIPIL